MATVEVDDEDMWGAVASPPPGISTSLSYNTRLQLLAGPLLTFGSPFNPGGGCYRNVAASPSSYSFSVPASPFPVLAPRDAGPSFRPSSAGWAGTSSNVAPAERRKKRMIKNRESASRSRARKHNHYTNIEAEVIELREKMEQLRIENYKLKATIEVSVPVQKKTLHRVLSSPF